jgi:glutaredoxin
MGKVTVYYSSATSDLGVKKNQQSLKFLLEKKKAHFEEVDLAQMDKEKRDAIYASAGVRTIPLVFVNDKFVGVRFCDTMRSHRN